MVLRPVAVFLLLAGLGPAAAPAQQRIEFQRQKFDRSRFERAGQPAAAPATAPAAAAEPAGTIGGAEPLGGTEPAGTPAPMVTTAPASLRLDTLIQRLVQEISGLHQLEPLRGSVQYERLRLAELELKHHRQQQAAQAPSAR